jgi:hypothetical protein
MKDPPVRALTNIPQGDSCIIIKEYQLKQETFLPSFLKDSPFFDFEP